MSQPKTKILNEGAYDKSALTITPSGVHGKKSLDAMAKAIKDGKVWVLDGKASRNTNYNLRERLEKEYGLKNLTFGYNGDTEQTLIYQA
jgi:hypothetical protein